MWTNELIQTLAGILISDILTMQHNIMLLPMFVKKSSQENIRMPVLAEFYNLLTVICNLA